jgi:hypothetical protein
MARLGKNFFDTYTKDKRESWYNCTILESKLER